MSANPKIIQLRQQLAERFPGLRTKIEDLPSHTHNGWPTGLNQIDQLLEGGLQKSVITEIVGEKNGSGGALCISWLLRKAAEENQIVALVDGQDSFDPAGFEQKTLARLFWIRCQTADHALKATDLILRDRNLPLLILDLQLNPSAQLRKIPSSIWYRLQRIVEATSTIFVVFTPHAMVGCAQSRLNLQSRFALNALEQNQSELLAKLKVELTQHRLHVSHTEERVANAG